VTGDRLGTRHVCGGWFTLPPGNGAGWQGSLRVESAWYVTEGALDVSWRQAAGPRQTRISRGTFLYVPPGLAIDARSAGLAAGLVLFGGATSPDRIAGAVSFDRRAGEPAAADGDRPPWIARVDELPSDTDYEPPLDMRWGVTDRLGGARLLCGARTLNPPRGRIQHHYHAGVEAVIFFLGGAFRVFSGPDREPIDVAPGDVAYIAPGTLHSYCSMETVGLAEEVAFYGGIASKEAAGTVFVEAPWSAPPER
jgi:uncharacterized RmlC-like cupin family protein